MGCTSSKLAGDDSSNIDAAAPSSTQAPHRSTKSDSAISPSGNTSKKDSHSPNSSKPKEPKPEKHRFLQKTPPPSAPEGGRSIDDVGPRAEPGILMLDGMELTPEPKPTVGDYMKGAPGSERFRGAAGVGPRERGESCDE